MSGVLVGENFGRLTVLSRAGRKGAHATWECLCACGGSITVKTCDLRSGNTRSCGCLRKEIASNIHSKHGLSNTTEYALWKYAKRRSKKSGIHFDITPEDIKIPNECPVLGVPLFTGTLRHHTNSPSLDRLDPSQGYIPTNIWVISHRANMIKSDATFEELQLLLKAISARQNGAPQ